MKLFFATIAFFASLLPALAGERCEMCERFHHPRERVTKPIACIPIKFVTDGPGTVVVRLKYLDGHTFSDSKPVPTSTGQFCFKPERFVQATQIELCDARHSALFDTQNPQHVSGKEWRDPAQGINLCLKGKEWCSTHSP